ncbi:GSCFA domain-containing protein [Adhaeribacter terreus]|uniref:GSCFA domain-containing protein n=1 Tax=Adhaeribacter terreus TaxID=529703 RepID=A0ABW0E5S0_9BACT
MNFRTELHPKPAPYKLNLASKVVTVGSCFSDVIGSQLEKYRVETLKNPFGTLFNPLSACKLLQICAGADVELAESFVENNGRWYSYDFHSSFSAETEEDLYEKLDEAIVKTRRFLKKADVLILTLGTANIFRLNITGETVANCHKLPAANFTRETLLPEEIITAVAETHSLLRELNPNLKLVLTVSPVRHLKDTLELNSVSKSVLRLATHFLTQSLPDITYFPAYELLLDDLRDYRFYQEDLLHPTPLAENYIWEKFTGAYFEDSFMTFTAEWDTVLRAKAHKPFHPESAQHQAFVQNILEKLQTLQEKVNVTDEIAYFENQVVVLPEPKDEEEEELEEAAAEEEVIPGYFTEEIEEQEAEEIAESSLWVETPETTEQAEQRKRKKKQRRKKKKPGITEDVSLSEVGSAAVSETPEVAEEPSEPAAELAEILADPDHNIAHYGETLAEYPIKRPLSKSAKRRESRRRKKALEALEQAKAAPIQEENAPALTEEIAIPEQSFAAENAMVSEEKTVGVAVEIPEVKAEEIPEEKPKQKKGGGRKKKNAFPELFAPEISAEPVLTAEVPEEKTIETLAETLPETALESANEPVSKTVAKKTAKPKPAGRRTKTVKLFKSEETIAETIAVPFLPATALDESGTIAVPFLPVSELETPETAPAIPADNGKKRGRPARTKAAKPETLAENVISEPGTKSEKPAKPVKKTTGRTKATTEKPARKKKAIPEA